MPRHTIPIDVPVGARCYDFCLGGKDNFPVDREFVRNHAARFPEVIDLVREGRKFLYRVVRYLARDVGIDQFIDMGTGLPTQENVHQVAQRFRPHARVVYVDNDPMVLTHGRALLAKNERTSMVSGDLTAPRSILDDPDVRRLIDFDRPVAVLFLAVLDFVVEDATVIAAMDSVKRTLPPGSHIALSHFAAEVPVLAAQGSESARRGGVELTWRSPEDIQGFAAGLEPVAPGFVDVSQWRPDPDQPELGDVDAELRPYLGASKVEKRVMAFGGVGRIPE
jgi:hypothetical protein